MATINDFKLVNKYSKEYFKNIKTKNRIVPKFDIEGQFIEGFGAMNIFE